MLVCWRLDRLGRNLADLLSIVADLEGRGIGFESVTENIDSSSPSGMLVFQIFGALSQFESNLIRERTIAGIKAARARGRVGGRRRMLGKHDIEMIRTLVAARDGTIEEIADKFGVSRSTVYRCLRGNEAVVGRGR